MRPGALLLALLDKLIAPLVRESQCLTITIALEGGCRSQRLRHGGEHAGINRVGLGEDAGSARKVARASGIDTGEGNAFHRERPAQPGIVMAGCFEHDEGAAALPVNHQGSDGFLRIGRPFAPADAALEHIQVVL